MRLINSLLIVLLLPSGWVMAATHSVTDAIVPNVVAVSTKIGKKTERGFGFIIGENEQFYYFATANHVIRGSKPGDKTTKLEVQFYASEAAKFKGELLPVSHRQWDIGFFRVSKKQAKRIISDHGDKPPLILFRWDSLGNYDQLTTNTTVSSIGKSGKWLIQSGANVTQVQNSPFITLTQLKVDVGSSGSPLIDADGIIALLSKHDGTTTTAVSIAAVKSLANQHGLPWNLNKRLVETDLSGTWIAEEKWEEDYDFGEPNPINITHIDAVRFKIESRLTEAKGYGILAGDDVRVWWSSKLWGEEFGKFVIMRRNNTISVLGTAVDEASDEAYKIRLTPSSSARENPTVSTPNKPLVASASATAGCWKLQNLPDLILKPDNTATSGGFNGQVRTLADSRFEILWDRFIDTLTLSGNKKNLNGKNNYNWPITANKTAGSTHSVVGVWDWGSATVEFKANHSVSLNGIPAGQWRIKSNGQVEINWDSRLNYTFTTPPGGSALYGTMGITFETRDPITPVVITPIHGWRC